MLKHPTAWPKPASRRRTPSTSFIASHPTPIMSHEIAKVATVELIRELERRLRCNDIKTEK
jgi:hypothetical protein